VGPDGLSPKLLLNVCNEIGLVYPLLLLFVKSFDESFVPHDWRQANITPVFKKGNQNGQQLDEVTQERHLGVIISNDLKVSQQCQLSMCTVKLQRH